MSGYNILVIGGTGMIGSTIAATLAARGDEVTIGSRRGPNERDPHTIEGATRLLGDYSEGGFSEAELEGFDAIVMAAGQDIRHVKPEDENDEYWAKVQGDGVPALAARAKGAGVRKFIQIGSYYHQLMPELVETNPYVKARQEADDGARALSGDGFDAITLNPPSIVGVATPRARRGFQKMAAWLRGETDAEPWAPAGGTNYMSVESLTQAVIGALERGEGGKAYLIGDESLSFQEYFQRVIEASGGDNTLEVGEGEHPLLPDRFIVQGRGATIAYEPDPEEAELLDYPQHDVTRALTAIFNES